MKIRLQKIIRDSTGISRRKAEMLISDGKVSINGEKAKLGDLADKGVDEILLNGKPLISNEEQVYIMLNKPSGYITSRKDPEKRKTVYDLLPEEFKHLFTVGRLDFDSEGLLLLTNDGDFAYTLTHPKFEIKKEYYVVIKGFLKDEEKEQIENGLDTKKIKSSPAKIKITKSNKGKTSLYITIHEGKNREIRRIFSVFGYKVYKLKRVRVGSLKLEDLQEGKWRELSKKEVGKLKNTAIKMSS